MPDSEPAGLAHDVTERESPPKHHTRWDELIEVVEVVVLALVAIATAWSGYQAAKWDGQQSVLYGTVSTDRFEANAIPPPGASR